MIAPVNRLVGGRDLYKDRRSFGLVGMPAFRTRPSGMLRMGNPTRRKTYIATRLKRTKCKGLD